MKQRNYGNFRVIDGGRNPEFLSEKLSEYSAKILEGIDNSIDQIGDLDEEEHLQLVTKIGRFYVDLCYFVAVYGNLFPELKDEFNRLKVKLFVLYSKLRGNLNIRLKKDPEGRNQLIEYLIGENAINPNLQKGNLTLQIVEDTKSKLSVVR